MLKVLKFLKVARWVVYIAVAFLLCLKLFGKVAVANWIVWVPIPSMAVVAVITAIYINKKSKQY